MKHSLLLHRELYDFDVIERGIRDYSDLAKISINQKANYYECEFSACKAEPELIMKEFSNYIIELSNVKE